MKRISTLIIYLFVTMVAMSQNTHLTFMGIPLNGSIKAFQTKLIAKGCQLNKPLNKIIPVGCRAFTGNFAGEEANIYVYYNEDTKTVYRAKAVMTYDESLIEQKYNYFVNMLSTKYALEKMDKGEQDGHESFSIIVSNSDGMSYKGIIAVYVGKNDYSLLYGQTIHVDYEDFENGIADETSKMDDL